MSENAVVETIEVDGYQINLETGEVLSMPGKDEFHVTDDKSAEWVLQKMMDAEAEIAKQDAKLKAVKDNLETLKRQYANQRGYLEYRFGEELKMHAKANLQRVKKTWTCLYGKVAFRATKERLKVADELRAVAFLEKEDTNAVKVKKSVLISNICGATKKAILEQPLETGFEIVPAGESITIKTGLAF